MGFSRQEYLSELPCPPPGDLLDLGIEPAVLTFPALAGSFFTTRATWEAHILDISPLPSLHTLSLEKEMATHSSVLTWRIPWTEEPGRLQSMGVTKSWTHLKLLSVHTRPEMEGES